MSSSQKPFDINQEATSGTSILRWLLRLLIVFVVVIICLVALLFLFFIWQDQRLDSVIRTQSNQTNLNPLERLYLRSYLASKSDELVQPIGSGSVPVPFVIEPGQHADQIADNLISAGLLKDANLFRNYLRFNGLDSKLEAGTFELNPELTIPELTDMLMRALPQDIELRFLEGWRLEEMANYLEAVKPADIDPSEFRAIVQRQPGTNIEDYDFLNSIPADASLEGFLFPDTYRVPLDADATLLVKLMLDNFGQRVTPTLRQAFGVQGLTVYEAVTLASIVQREAMVAEERPLMVGVFLNRLVQGNLLQADPTVQYALGYQADTDVWWKSPLTATDLQVGSPYNTYVHSGLPPGPIANPGLHALEAVASPESTSFLFFVVDCTAETPGSHVFSLTFEEHLSHVERCR